MGSTVLEQSNNQVIGPNNHNNPNQIHRKGRSTLNLDHIPDGYIRKDTPLPQIDKYSDKNINLLLRVFQNTLRMLSDRGYPEANADYLHFKDISIEQFFREITEMINPTDPSKTNFFRCLSRVYKNSQPTTDHPATTEAPRTTVVYFQEDYKDVRLGIANVRPFFEYIMNVYRESIGPLKVIYIHATKLENETIEQIGEINRSHNSINIARFNYVDLCYVSVDNLSVPKHRIADQHEMDELLKCIKTSSIPPICWNDPIRLYYGFPLGSLIRVTRTNSVYSSIMSETIYYRLVVSSLLEDKLVDEQYTIKEIFSQYSKPIVVKTKGKGAKTTQLDEDDVTLEEEAAIAYQNFVQTGEDVIGGDGDNFGGIDQDGNEDDGGGDKRRKQHPQVAM